jgi:FKBP-type peptidyl-prolyl cis-trans isomerase
MEMMKTRIISLSLVTLLCFSITGNVNAQKKIKLKTSVDSLSYALGVANFQYYNKDSIFINPDAFARGVKDASKKKSSMDETVASNFIVKYMQDRENKKNARNFRKQIEAGEKFLTDNSKQEGVVTTPSGLQYKVISEGIGEKPGPDDMVKVQYTGKTIDGRKFDSSYDHNEPATFKLNGVIKGWQEGLQLMPVGSKYMFYLPAKLAYGERGAGSIIKPFETLIFEVELLEIVKQ